MQKCILCLQYSALLHSIECSLAVITLKVCCHLFLQCSALIYVEIKCILLIVCLNIIHFRSFVFIIHFSKCEMFVRLVFQELHHHSFLLLLYKCYVHMTSVSKCYKLQVLQMLYVHITSVTSDKCYKCYAHMTSVSKCYKWQVLQMFTWKMLQVTSVTNVMFTWQVFYLLGSHAWFVMLT